MGFPVQDFALEHVTPQAWGSVAAGCWATVAPRARLQSSVAASYGLSTRRSPRSGAIRERTSEQMEGEGEE